VTTALVLLVVAWAAVLGYRFLRSRRSSPSATIGGFERSTGALGTEVPAAERGASRAPASALLREDPLTVRRRVRFVRLVAATLVTLVVALWLGGVVWTLFLAALIATSGYVVVLRRLKVQRDEAREVVRELHLRPPDLQMAMSGRAAAGAEGLTGAMPSTSVRLRRWDA
jgi:membrane protein implicated in regulation of membrane protease activity